MFVGFFFFSSISNYGLEVLIPKGGMLLSADTIMVPLNWELKIAPRCFGAPCATEPAGEEGNSDFTQETLGWGYTVGAGRTVFGIPRDGDCSFLCRKR